jgi:hypothetical protein
MTNKLDTQKLDTQKIAQLLTQSTLQLDETTLSALVNARQNALKKQLVGAPIFALTPASLSTARDWSNRLISPSAQLWIAAGLLAAALVAGTSYWQHVKEQQIDDLDVAILTDDLPIEVFVD